VDGMQYLDLLRSQTSDSFIPYLIQLTGNTIFGVLIGFECFLKQRKRKGKWSFNVPRFVLMGIPSLIFGLYFLVYCFDVIFTDTIINFLPEFLASSTWLFTISQILFGYVLITDFSKQKNTNEILPSDAI
jgi:hypothetical protein